MDPNTMIIIAGTPVYGFILIGMAKLTQILFMSQAQTQTVETASAGK